MQVNHPLPHILLVVYLYLNSLALMLINFNDVVILIVNLNIVSKMILSQVLLLRVVMTMVKTLLPLHAVYLLSQTQEYCEGFLHRRHYGDVKVNSSMH
jgi:hypothetical protein